MISAIPAELSVGDRIARIQQLYATLVSPPQQATATPAATPATSSSFASALSSAQATSATPTQSSAAARGLPFGAEIDAAAARYGIDPTLLAGLVHQESGFDPGARSGAGAVGLTQLMPQTAQSLGVTNPLDPQQSLDGGARYLREQLDRFGGDTRLALAAYNAGPGAVQQYGGVPPYGETQAYVRNIMAYVAQNGASVA